MNNPQMSYKKPPQLIWQQPTTKYQPLASSHFIPLSIVHGPQCTPLKAFSSSKNP